MEPLLMGLIPGLLGGAALALILFVYHPRLPGVLVHRPMRNPTTDMINIAHIEVDGVGGLGLVAAVLMVAITDPRVRAAVAIAAVLGSLLAYGLIAYRRRRTGLGSDHDDPDDRLTLGLDHEHQGSRPKANGAGPFTLSLQP